MRVVIHKTSRFEPEEREGFEQALRGVSRIRPRVVDPDQRGASPASRASTRRCGAPCSRSATYRTATRAATSSLGRYPHGHVPSPLQVADHVGDTPKSQLLREIMVLTKMNWNSANMSGLMPITLRFSRLVSDMLARGSGGVEPESKYKFYM